MQVIQCFNFSRLQLMMTSACLSFIVSVYISYSIVVCYLIPVALSFSKLSYINFCTCPLQKNGK